MIRLSNFKHFFPIFILFSLIGGCAKVGSPSGGPLDRTPPEVVRSIPPSGTTNFTDKKIIITFNEFIQLNEINQKFMVSPPMDNLPELRLKGKNLEITYEDDLRENTTYTFYFQDAIRDLNEGNPIDNYSFVFSTGPALDSLTVTGNVLKAYDLNPPEDVMAMLYSDLSDSAFIKKVPDYISRVDENGYFRIDNIREGSYRIYALKDVDNSKNYNLPDEEIAFLDTVLNVNVTNNYLPLFSGEQAVSISGEEVDTIIPTGDHKLILFKPFIKNYYLTSSLRNEAYKLSYTLSVPPDTIGFSFSLPGADEDSYFIEESRKKDTLVVWLKDSTIYSQPIINTVIRYPFSDTSGVVIQREDTVKLRYISPRTVRGKQTPAPYRFTSSVSGGTVIPGKDIIFSSPTPFREPDTTKIRLFHLKDEGQINLPYIIKKDTLNSCRIYFNAEMLPGEEYLFIAFNEAFGDIYGAKSDSTGIKIRVRENSSFGKLIVNVQNHVGKRIIQLLSSDETIAREVKMDEDGKAEFPLLNKGLYRMRIIYDLNGDGEWTTGDYSARRQPEPVSFMPREIEVMENWENELYWNVALKNVKKFRIEKPVSSGRRR